MSATKRKQASISKEESANLNGIFDQMILSTMNISSKYPDITRPQLRDKLLETWNHMLSDTEQKNAFSAYCEAQAIRNKSDLAEASERYRTSEPSEAVTNFIDYCSLLVHVRKADEDFEIVYETGAYQSILLGEYEIPTSALDKLLCDLPIVVKGIEFRKMERTLLPRIKACSEIVKIFPFRVAVKGVLTPPGPVVFG